MVNAASNEFASVLVEQKKFHQLTTDKKSYKMKRSNETQKMEIVRIWSAETRKR